MATTRQAATVAARPVNVNGSGPGVDAAPAARPRAGRTAGPSGPAGAAQACVIAARSALPGGAPDGYTRLLYAARAIERSVPGDGRISQVVRRMLGAADAADGPVNGADRVIEAMEAEAAAIAAEPRSR